MNEQCQSVISEKLLKKSYLEQASQALGIHQNKIRLLLEQRKCPDIGWDEATIELFLQNLALMDSNNFPGGSQMGEREARFASEIVRRRHFRMGHGIGRSGDLQEQQPKAAGSTLLNQLTNQLVLHILQTCGVPSTKSCFVVPSATGMSLVLCMLYFKRQRPDAKYVIWPRIDQKTCYKSMLTAGLEPLVIDGCLEGTEIRTNLEAIKEKVDEVGAKNILCILSTTSCFAPRTPDDLVGIGEICKLNDIPHLVNNAYGVQSTKCMSRLEQANKHGRVDLFVQSTDKNFMVPVGGAIIAGFNNDLVTAVGKSYPGRASATPSMDLLITLLNVGIKGYKDIIKQRKAAFHYLSEQLEALAEKREQMMLKATSNDISIGFTLNAIDDEQGDVTSIGSMLFKRFVFGTRTVDPEKDKEIEGRLFKGWGSHYNRYPHSYLTAAVAMGTTKEDVDIFISKLDKILAQRRNSIESTVMIISPKGARRVSVHRTSIGDKS